MGSHWVFKDRTEAGRLLADRLTSFRDSQTWIVALPNGGVPVAAEVAKRLMTPLTVLAIRKIGAPDSPEFGFGAVTEEGFYWIDPAQVQGWVESLVSGRDRSVLA